MLGLGLLALWLLLAGRSPDGLSTWFDHESLPNLGVWVLLVAAVAAIVRYSRITITSSKPRPLFLVPAAALIGLAIVLASALPVAAHWIYLGGAAAGVIGLIGSGWLGVWAPSLVLLTLMPGLPPPLHVWLVDGLQWLTMHAAYMFSVLVLSDDYLRLGHTIFLPDNFLAPGVAPQMAVTVEAECSGYRSFYGALLLAGLGVADPRLSIRRSITFFVMCLLIAVLLNWGRVFLSIVLHHIDRPDLARGFAHAMLGNVAMGVMVVLIFLVYRKLLISSPREPRRAEAA